MLISFDHISDKARVWVYQASRELTMADIDLIDTHAPVFVQSWTAHNQQLEASFIILENIFLVLAVDESKTEASGCSIDKSVHFIKFLESKLNLSFTDRTRIAIKNNAKIEFLNFNDFKDNLKSGSMSGGIKLFNTLAKTKEEMIGKWLMNLEESPYARFLLKAN